MLSCSCGEWEGEGVGYYGPTEFTQLQSSKRKRCQSCEILIDVGSDCVKFDRMRYPNTEMEVKILGEDHEIFLAPHYFCGDCGGICLSLTEVGFCIGPWDDMRVLLKEYQQQYAHPAWESFKNHSKQEATCP